LAQAARRVIGDLSRTPRPLGAVMLGAVMGFLPCMLPLWVLGLSALTGSAVHGAALMLLLVAMTTPVLLVVTLLPRLAPVLSRARGRRVPAAIATAAPAFFMGVSGVWLLLVGSAGLGLIGHAHLGFTLAGRGFLIMFF
jgi:sulfite exporter TauE/SafE